MPFISEMTMTSFWIAAIIVFLVIEAITVGLASIWFAIGSLAALIGEVLGAKLWLQIALFLAVSAVTLILTRPLVKKFVNGKAQPTNADMVIGMDCRVTETIDNIAGTGAVQAAGKVWTARSGSDEIIEAGQIVRINRIEGVKVIVEKAAEADKIMTEE